MPNYPQTRKFPAGLLASAALAAVALSASLLWGCPQYKVWQQRMAGEAELARASENRRIRIAEAEAKRDSAKLEAEAEILRAQGMARANQILGESLAGEQGDRYLRFLYINGLEKGDNRETIYVATEAGMPILEAGRLAPRQKGAPAGAP